MGSIKVSSDNTPKLIASLKLLVLTLIQSFLLLLLKFYGVWLGWLDNLIYVLNLYRGKDRPRFFSDGWGNNEKLEQAIHLYDQSSEESCAKQCIDCIATIQWFDGTEYVDDFQRGINTSEDEDITLKQARFLSPLKDLLPQESKYCYFCYLYLNSFDIDRPPVTTMMLPCTGETGPEGREHIAKKLARKHGWTSIIMNAPYYGVRSPGNQQEHFIRTVSDFLLQSIAIIQETAVLSRHILDKGCFVVSSTASSPTSSPFICIAGFSWGASMAVCSSAAAVNWGGDGRRIACVPYVGSATPAVLVAGALNSYVDYNAIRRGDETDDEVKNHLHGVLSEAQISQMADKMLMKACGGGIHKIAAVAAATMLNDQIVTLEYSTRLKDQLHRLSDNVSTYWLPGGHVVALLLRGIFQTRAIENAVITMQENYVSKKRT